MINKKFHVLTSLMGVAMLFSACTATPTETRTPAFSTALVNTSMPTETRTPSQTATLAITSTPTEPRTPSLTATLANTSTPQGTATPIMTPTPTLGIGSTILRQEDAMLMMYVPEGEFLMGSDPAKDKNAQYDEQPQHSVYLDAYWIDQTEVTNGMYAKCVSAGKCFLPQNDRTPLHHKYYGTSKYADYPVVFVDWNQAKAYCAWAGADLPTEAQWEKASRGTDGRLYHWGDASPSSNLLNYGNVGDTTEVGHYPDGASPYGALDMSGNVWEWVNDLYDIYPSPGNSSLGSLAGGSRDMRGAAYYLIEYGARSADRSGMEPTYRDNSTGFRCASTP